MVDVYSYVVIDDDDFARDTLLDLLREFEELKLLKSISESGMAIKYLATLEPDIVFLDINMPNKSGIDIQNEILDLRLKSKVIFTTSHDEYVLEAFKNQAFDYLIKPVNKKELNDTLNRFFNQKNENVPQITENKSVKNLRNQSGIVIKNSYGALILQDEDIVYIEADGSYSTIYLVNGKTELVSKNIGKIEQLFSKELFFKISRTHIINTKYLMKTDRLNKKIVLMFSNQTIQLKTSREKFYDLEVYLMRKNEN